MGGFYPNFWCVFKEYCCKCGGGGLCRIFLCVLGRGVIPKFLVCNHQRILLRVWGLMPDFFMRTKKKYWGGRLYLNFWVCTQRILLRVWGGGLCQIFLCVIEKKLGGGGGYSQIFGVYSKNITASVRGGGLWQIFLCVLENY